MQIMTLHILIAIRTIELLFVNLDYQHITSISKQGGMRIYQNRIESASNVI